MTASPRIKDLDRGAKEHPRFPSRRLALVAALFGGLTIAGFILPLFRIPLLGEMGFRGLHGCGPLKAWIGGISLIAGPLLLWKGFPWAGVVVGAAGSGLVILSILSFVIWMQSRLTELEAAGLMPQKANGSLLLGGWALGLGSLFAFAIWITVGLALLLARKGLHGCDSPRGFDS